MGNSRGLFGDTLDVPQVAVFQISNLLAPLAGFVLSTGVGSFLELLHVCYVFTLVFSGHVSLDLYSAMNNFCGSAVASAFSQFPLV